MEIIKLKNKILFLGKNNVNENKYIEEFNKYKDAIVYYSNTIGEYTEENIMINDNPEKNEKLINLITSLNQIEIMQFKDYIKKYMDDNDDNMLNNAINMYITEIIPKLKEIRDLKYKTMYINHDEDKNKILIQSKYSPEEMNFYDKDVDEVVRFIKGIKVGEITKNKLKISETKEKSKSKSITLKNTGKTLKTKTKKRILKIEKEKSKDPEESEDLDVEVEFEIPKEISEKEKELEEESEEEINIDLVFESDSSNNEEDKITSVAEPINVKSLKISSVPKKIGEKIVLNEATEALEK